MLRFYLHFALKKCQMASFMKIFPRTYTNFQFFQRGAWPLSESLRGGRRPPTPPFEYAPDAMPNYIPFFYYYIQCFGSGSGSAWIRMFLASWIRIRIRNFFADSGSRILDTKNVEITNITGKKMNIFQFKTPIYVGNKWKFWFYVNVFIQLWRRKKKLISLQNYVFKIRDPDPGSGSASG